jgi:hypothetical protein
LHNPTRPALHPFDAAHGRRASYTVALAVRPGINQNRNVFPRHFM